MSVGDWIADKDEREARNDARDRGRTISETWEIRGVTLGERQICELLAVTNVFHRSEYGQRLEKLHGKRVRIIVQVERKP